MQKLLIAVATISFLWLTGCDNATPTSGTPNRAGGTHEKWASLGAFLVDTDEDGDLDLFSVGHGKELKYFENINGEFEDRGMVTDTVALEKKMGIGIISAEETGDGIPDLSVKTYEGFLAFINALSQTER